MYRLVRYLPSLFVAVATISVASLVAAQPQRTVGNLRIGDTQGEAIGVVMDAGPGEKVHRLESATSSFQVWIDFEGTTNSSVQVRVMAPQGVILDQQSLDLSTPGSYSLEFSFDPPLADDEYVINAYVGDSNYLADSLQLLIGDAELIDPDVSTSSEVRVDPGSPSNGVLTSDPLPGGPGASPNSNVVPSLGPSPMLLVLAAFGVLMLLGVVAWAGMSALRTS